MKKSALTFSSCALFVGSMLGSAASAPGVAVRFEIVLRVPGLMPAAGRLAIRPSETLAAPRPGVASSTRSPLFLTLSAHEPNPVVHLPPGSHWEVSGEIPGFWLRPEQVVVGAPGDAATHRLKIWPLGRIAGSIQLAHPKAKRPEEVMVTTLAPRIAKGPTDLPRGQLRCPVDAKGGWSCALPAATFDLAITAEGFVPHYLWDVAVPGAKTRDLGAFRFEKGSSVAGWVEAPGEGYRPEACSVRLTPLTLPGGNLAMAEKLRATAREVRPKATGFFQLSGVAPGSYALEIQHEGFAPARVAPVRVEHGAESFVTPAIVLRRPLRIEVAVDPPLDWQERPWLVRMMRAGEFGGALDYEALFEGAANALGVVEIPTGASGVFSIDVIDSTGQTLAAERGVRIDDEESARHVVSVRWIEIEGTLRRGKEPLAGTLWFGGERGAVSVRMDADTEGHFGGVLPKVADWVVEIAASKPALRLVRRVQVQTGADDRAEIEIAMPTARVFGRVIDENGKPVEAARVVLSPKDDFLLAEPSTDQGSFEFSSVPAGSIEIAATLGAGEAFAEPIALSVVEGQDLGPVDLRLLKGKPYRGTVISNRGPVAGARISAFPSVPPMGMSGDVHTNLLGVFRLNFPPSVQRFVAVVSAPGAAFRAFDLAVGEAVTLRVTDDSGTVRLQISEEAKKMRVLRFFQDGIEVPLFLLRRWARGQGALPSHMLEEFPALAPSEIEVCLAVPDKASHSDEEPGEKSACARGTLRSGDVLDLAL